MVMVAPSSPGFTFWHTMEISGMFCHLSSGGNEAIKESRQGGIGVPDPIIGIVESNCETKLWTHRLFQSRSSGLTMEYIEFFNAGMWPSPRTCKITGNGAGAGIGEAFEDFIAGHTSSLSTKASTSA